MLELIANILEQSSIDFIIISKSDMQIKKISCGLASKWRCHPQAIVGEKLMKLGRGRITAAFLKNEALIQTLHQAEVVYSPKSGPVSISKFTAQSIGLSDGQYILLIADANTIEEFAETKSTERRLNLALRSGGYALWDHNFETGETYNSPEMKQIFGEQVDGKPLTYLSLQSLIHPDDQQKSINSKIERAPYGTDVFQTRYRIRNNKGKYAWVETVASLERDSVTNTPTKCVGLCRNVDHEMLTMDRLKNSELMLKRTQAVSHIGSFKLRIESGVSRLTAELAAMIGLGDAMIHPNLDTFIKLIESQDRAKFLEAIELASIGKQIKNLEISVKKLSGGIEWFAVTLEPERSPSGKIENIFGACQLITERKSLEDRFHQAQKMEAVGQLTGGIAHDFNNLLMVVIGNLQLVENMVKSDEKATKRIRAAIEAADKGSDLTKRMLAFSRQQALHNRDLETNTMVLAMHDMLQQAVTAAVELSILPNEDVWQVKADKTMLETAILNLAINARDAMGLKGGKLIIETHNRTLDQSYAETHEEVLPGDYVEIAVTDTGSGISPENLPKVFQPFFTTKGPEAGSGLGLSMIYGFVKQSGGHVKIYSEVGVGTSVKLYLPRNITSDAALPATIQPDTIDAAPFVLSHRKLKVLIVEDNDSVRDVAAAMIEEMGFETIMAANGPEGLESITQTPDIDLVLSDVIMAGGMNGPELIAKAIKLRPELKVLFMSGYAPGSVRQMQDLPGEIELVNKPFTRAELTEKVKRALSLTLAA